MQHQHFTAPAHPSFCYPIHESTTPPGIKKVIMSTYQAASGAGAEGMAELEDGIRQFVKGEKVTNEFFAYPLPFNVIPQARLSSCVEGRRVWGC